jgi:hypothetical protein
MNIPDVKRFWIKPSSQGRKDKDPFYNGSTWKQIRESFISSAPWLKLQPIRGIEYSNRYCAECWQKGRINDERIEIDHIQEVKDGGSRSDQRNLRSLCHAHHNSKTHAERKKRA